MVGKVPTAKIDILAVRVGMYISRLDISWSATNYPQKGFLIKHRAQIEELKKICHYVYIDVIRLPDYTIRPLQVNLNPHLSFPTPKPKLTNASRKGICNSSVTTQFANFSTQHYPVSTKFKKEIKVADVVLRDAASKLELLLNQKKDLTSADIQSLQHVTTKLVSSALRNPDALVWLCKIKNADKKIYSSILNSAVTGIVFARDVGLFQDQIEILSQALLLRGIGIVKMDKRKLIAYRPGEETLDYFRHIDLTIEELERCGNFNPSVINTIQNHCERFDGTGYPANKVAAKIPMLAQIMGIIAFYESCINPLVESRTLSPASAISRLFEVSNHQFSKLLIEQFVKSIGIYPVGSYVQLSDKSIGLVLEQNENQRLKPKLALLKDKFGTRFNQLTLIDLYNAEQVDDLYISQGVTYNEFPINKLNIDHSILNTKRKLPKLISLFKAFG